MRPEAEMQAERARYDVYSRIAERLSVTRDEAKNIVYIGQISPHHYQVVREEVFAFIEHMKRYRREQ